MSDERSTPPRESRPQFKAALPDVAYWMHRVPCQMACPVLTDCGKYVQLIADGRLEEAFLTARAPNPAASSCGRICAAPCEDYCRRGVIDKPVSIRALKRCVTERFGVESRAPQTWHRLWPHGEEGDRCGADPRDDGAVEPGNRWPWHLASPAFATAAARPRTGRKVAVVGAGPAGLACAHDLALLGHTVIVFEATDRAGGMAFHGIPEFRLPRSVLDKEIAALEEIGVEFRYRTPLTAEFGLQAVREHGCEAVFIAVGLQRGRWLNCPGSELDGIVRAIDYLINANNGYRLPSGRRILVVGGGLVAFDAARMAIRAGAGAGATGATALDAARIAVRRGAEVTLASLESYDEMPALRTEQGREEFADALREGIQFLPQRGVKRFLPADSGGRVARVEMVGVQRTYDEAGRFAPVYDDTIRQVVQADLVILAIGQQADLSFLAAADGVATTAHGTIQIDAETLGTTARGVYAGGDAAFGPRNLIDAVADGKRAAESIDRYLRGSERRASPHFRFEKIPTKLFARSARYEQIPRQAPPTTDLGRRTGISEVEEVYGDEQARRQAERCLACHLQTIYDATKCVLCNRCVDVCPENCLKLVPVGQLAMDPNAIEAVARQGGVAEPAGASAMLKDDTRCIRCGLCAIRCPTDAMTMEMMSYEHR